VIGMGKCGRCGRETVIQPSSTLPFRLLCLACRAAEEPGKVVPKNAAERVEGLMIGKDEIARLIEAAEIDSGQFARAGTALAEQREHIAALEAVLKRWASCRMIRGKGRIRPLGHSYGVEVDSQLVIDTDAALRGEGRE